MSSLCLCDSARSLCRYGSQPRRLVSSFPSGAAAAVGRQGHLATTPLRVSRSQLQVCAASAELEPPVVEAAAPVKNPAENKKLRIRLKSFHVEPMKEAVQMILDAANQTGARVSGPVPLPTKRRLYCVLRSPHVDKDSREHFEIRIHSRLIDIQDMSSETIDQLMGLDIPAGVDANIKIL